jgi:hypothetical protein
VAISDPTVKRVILRFEVQADKAEDDLDKLKKKSKEATGGLFSDLKGVNEGINTSIKKLGELGLAFEGMSTILEFARDAIREWGQDLRLEASTAGIAIDKLSDALHGMVEEDTLREFAAKTAGGALKLTQTQMEKVSEAALALTSRGYTLTESLRQLEDAAVSGRTRGLHALGIDVEEGASKFETAKNMMAALDKVIVETGPHIDTQADKVDRLAAKWSDAVKEAKNYAAAAAGAVVDDPLGVLGKIGSFFTGQGGSTGFDIQEWAKANPQNPFDVGLKAYRQRVQFDKNQHAFAQGIASGRQTGEDLRVIDMPEDVVSRSDAEKKAMAKAAAENAARAILRSAIASVDRNLPNAGADQRELANFFGRGTIGGSTIEDVGLGQAADTGVYNEYGALQSDPQGMLDRLYKSRGLGGIGRSLGEGARRQSVMQKMFGSVDEINGYTVAFQALSGAVTSSLQAWISGSMSAGEAIKRGIGQALAGVASQMAIEGLKHGAFAIGSAAFGDFAGSARHAAAAAAFGAGAIAAAAAARKLGSNAATDQKSAGASAGGASVGGGYQNGGGSRTVVYAGGMWGAMGDSARMQQIYMERAVGEAFVKNSLGAAR